VPAGEARYSTYEEFYTQEDTFQIGGMAKNIKYYSCSTRWPTLTPWIHPGWPLWSWRSKTTWIYWPRRVESTHPACRVLSIRLSIDKRWHDQPPRHAGEIDNRYPLDSRI